MADITDYTALITSEHADKPKFMAMIRATLQPLVDAINVANSLPAAFDLDSAIGAQLDVVGLWVGISRHIRTPPAVYFSFDTDGLGFDQGVWKGPFDPGSGVVSLDDETFRVLLRAKIGANHWDGTLEQSRAIFDQVFQGGTHVFVEDRQDMTITIGVSGVTPSALQLALLTGGYIPIKPEGVRANYLITTESGAALFGFDMNNEFVAGFDVGAFGSAA